MKSFLTLVGLVMIVEGLPYFASPGPMKEWVRKIQYIKSGSEGLRLRGHVCGAGNNLCVQRIKSFDFKPLFF